MRKVKIYHDDKYCWAIIIKTQQTIHTCSCSQAKLYKEHFPNVINLIKKKDETT